MKTTNLILPSFASKIYDPKVLMLSHLPCNDSNQVDERTVTFILICKSDAICTLHLHIAVQCCANRFSFFN